MNKYKIVKYKIIVNELNCIVERAKNDTYGNPRYNIDIFKDGIIYTFKNVQSYSIEDTIKSLINNYVEV